MKTDDREGEGDGKGRDRGGGPTVFFPRFDSSILPAPGGRSVFMQDLYDVTGYPHFPAVDGGGGTDEAPERQGG